MPMIDVNDYQCTAGRFHEVQFRKTADWQGLVFEGDLMGCGGCSRAKWLRKRIKQSTPTQAGQKLETVFLVWSSPKMVESLGRKRNTLVVRDGISRHTWVYFICHKFDAAELFEQFLLWLVHFLSICMGLLKVERSTKWDQGGYSWKLFWLLCFTVMGVSNIQLRCIHFQGRSMYFR